jgi:hypothetical protein
MNLGLEIAVLWFSGRSRPENVANTYMRNATNDRL